MKNKVKILLFSAILMPIVTFSCSTTNVPTKDPKSDKETSRSIKNDSVTYKENLNIEIDVVKIHYDLENKLNSISKISELYVPVSQEVYTKINQQNQAKHGYFWKYKFFDHVTDPLYSEINESKVIKISTKQEFDNIIIKRYQELNSVDDYKPKVYDIINQFEKEFLNYQNIYQLLENNDLYILQSNKQGSFHNLVIPFITDDSLELNVFYDYNTRIGDDRIVKDQKWKVLSLPKKQNFKLNTYFADNKFNLYYPLEKSKEYYNKLSKWYKEEFKKYYKD